MRSLTLAILMIFFLSNSCFAAGESLRLTPDAVRQSCYDIGPIKTVGILSENNEAQLSFVMNQIATGDDAWLSVVRPLFCGVDAGSATYLTVSLAEALPKNPRGILKLEDRGLSLTRICSIPFIEPEQTFVDAYAKNVFTALETVHEDYLQEAKENCLRSMNKTLTIIAKNKVISSQKP